MSDFKITLSPSAVVQAGKYTETEDAFLAPGLKTALGFEWETDSFDVAIRPTVESSIDVLHKQGAQMSGLMDLLIRPSDGILGIVFGLGVHVSSWSKDDDGNASMSAKAHVGADLKLLESTELLSLSLVPDVAVTGNAEGIGYAFSLGFGFSFDLSGFAMQTIEAVRR